MEEFMDNTMSNTNDYALFLLPLNARTIKILIDELLDMLEYQDSFMYHEYPDKNELLRYVDQIYSSPSFPDKHPYLKDLAQTMLVYEILNRRTRYSNFINNQHMHQYMNQPINQPINSDQFTIK